MNLASFDGLKQNELLALVEKYIIDGAKWPDIAVELRRQYHSIVTKKQWSSKLTAHGFFKNVDESEIIDVLGELERLQLSLLSLGNYTLLVVANHVLLNPQTIERYRQKNSNSLHETISQGRPPQPRRHPMVVPLPFEFRMLNDPDSFKCFRRMLWLVSVHFTSCFDTRKWTNDENGLYNRHDVFRSDLTQLSRLHNILFDAINQHNKKEKDSKREWTLIRDAFWSLDQIVKTNHHRQLPDILGIIHMLKKGWQPREHVSLHDTIHFKLCQQLNSLAEVYLEGNDPRRKLIALLKRMLEEQEWNEKLGYVLHAFDTYCRRLWMDRLGRNDIKAYYSYNQASFPRSESEPGEFYEKFQGKQLSEILRLLTEVDGELGRYSHPTFCLWHTALSYLFQEKRYSDAEVVCQELSKRILHPEGDQTFDDGQLNFDSAKTMYSLGSSQRAQAKRLISIGRKEDGDSKLSQALANLQIALALRRRLVPIGKWDPLSQGMLEALVAAGTALGLDQNVGVWDDQLRMMETPSEGRLR
ncbi:uncharacterized protein Z519_00546 [Cladophialophora bantiana CBS 173.52]|uniref:Clr5 domain-containing protein n=1 Tax=Cladophialophora bantiana (strain ATCC 10958 / CBS 173.52 / CDC B-1940 / NIH 8579) TaxID=1442370 RepID=A0A0D2HZJ4_CLAB1|nr:uncharacterized protein Z519_00546 [Cladophialophora bantiana CBS 173.52]KIW98883.1 hypothetical protein Z519_00546 [Cladophialophora bantiana CBS 173.52]